MRRQVTLAKLMEMTMPRERKDQKSRKGRDKRPSPSEKRYRTILDSIEDGYYEVDLSGNLTYFNDSMCRILGYPREVLFGMNNRQFMDKENAKKVYRAFNQVYLTGEADKGLDWTLLRQDGTRISIETSISLIRNEEGLPAGFHGKVDFRE